MPCEVSNGFAGHRLFIEKSPVFQLADDSAEVAGVTLFSSATRGVCFQMRTCVLPREWRGAEMHRYIRQGSPPRHGQIPLAWQASRSCRFQPLIVVAQCVFAHSSEFFGGDSIGGDSGEYVIDDARCFILFTIGHLHIYRQEECRSVDSVHQALPNSGN